MKELLKKQKEFFFSGKTKSLDFRIQKLSELRDCIIRNEKEIAEALQKDLNKSLTESYMTEIGVTLEEIKYVLKNLRSWAEPKRLKTPLTLFKAKSYLYPEPYGLTLIIGTWNYPFLLCMSPLIGAISAGNCAIMKPSEISPNCSKIIAKIINEVFEEEHVRAIEGGVETATELLEQKFDYIFYTGSINVGKIVMEKASHNLTPVTLELGGKSPCIVDTEIDIKTTARRIVWGKFINAGQTCIAPDYLYAHKSIKKELIEEIRKSITEFFTANPEESPDFPRIVSERHWARLSNFLNSGKIIIGGEKDKEKLYIAPTVIETELDAPVMQEEIFGPILPVFEYENIDTVIEYINHHPKPLALYLFSDDRELQEKIINNTSSGGVCVNGTIQHQVSPLMPFGGVGDSGMGAYHGKYSFDTFSHQKSVLVKSFFPDVKMVYPPYKNKLKFLRKIWG